MRHYLISEIVDAMVKSFMDNKMRFSALDIQLVITRGGFSRITDYHDEQIAFLRDMRKFAMLVRKAVKKHVSENKDKYGDYVYTRVRFEKTHPPVEFNVYHVASGSAVGYKPMQSPRVTAGLDERVRMQNKVEQALEQRRDVDDENNVYLTTDGKNITDNQGGVWLQTKNAKKASLKKDRDGRLRIPAKYIKGAGYEYDAHILDSGGLLIQPKG